jgi:uncharacterized protein with PIN domain
MPECDFRFYEELNDFLPPARRKRTFAYRFQGTPAVKDAIEALGVPHTEVDLVLVDGASVRFSHRLRGGERVAIYPVFERLDITPLVRLRPAPLRTPRFVADVHLGTLARSLRLLGFDTLYDRTAHDPELVRRSVAERRILLTRDVGLLKHKVLTHAHYVRATSPDSQLEELVRALDLARSAKPFTRCLRCNGRLARVARRDVVEQVPEAVGRQFRRFARCTDCGRIYWPGSHYERLRNRVARLVRRAKRSVGTSGRRPPRVRGGRASPPRASRAPRPPSVAAAGTSVPGTAPAPRPRSPARRRRPSPR